MAHQKTGGFDPAELERDPAGRANHLWHKDSDTVIHVDLFTYNSVTAGLDALKEAEHAHKHVHATAAEKRADDDAREEDKVEADAEAKGEALDLTPKPSVIRVPRRS